MSVPKRPTTNWDDPCARWLALRNAFFEITAGNNASAISYTSNGVARSVSYSVHDLSNLKQEVDKAEAECKTGQPLRRMAFTFGHRRAR